MTRKAWCPTCRIVDIVDESWRCVWCETTTLTELTPARAKRSALFHEPEIRAMHARYAIGERLPDIAREAHAHEHTLRMNFWALGLPTRTHSDASRLSGPTRNNPRFMGPNNPQWRHDLATSEIVASYHRTRSIRQTAREFGASYCLIRTRLINAGSTINPRGNSRNLPQRALA